MFPLTCINCKEVGEIICDNCLYNCQILDTQFCISCDKPSFNGFTHKKCYLQNKSQITQNISIFNYKDLVRECIKTSKFGAKRFITLKKLAYEACYLLNEFNHLFKGFTIVPVPSSNKRINKRGFNQSLIIAKIFSKKLQIPLDNSIINRKLDTTHQFKLNKKNRRLNLKGSFVIQKEIKNKKILIVDDIITSGSTLREISDVLYKSGAKEVRSLTLSKMYKKYK